MPTNEQTTPRFKRVVRWLRKNFPTERPVVVRTPTAEAMPGLHGLCLIDDERVLIRVTMDVEQVMIDALIEEWVHALRQECPVPIEDDHDSIFWAIYGTVSMKYRGE
jgi:hypothetical protein